MGLLVNIDNGGTFTDVCISDGQRVLHAKSPTTAHDLTQCLVDVLIRGSEQLYGERDLSRLIQDTDYLRYSTTSGTNALIERKGTPVGLIVETGEEDSLYGAAALVANNELWFAMVPQRPTGISVPEHGELESETVAAVVNGMLSLGVQRIVVALRSPTAEDRVKDVLLQSYPRHLLGAVPFLVSYELAKDADDARRTITAVVNSYLHPGMEHFLYGAENMCKRNHLRRPLLIFRNDGNSSRVAKTTALKTWGSGPRGGLQGSLAYASLYGVGTLLSMDIGGTTTDLSVVNQQQIALMAHGEVGDLETSFALPDLHSFGAGGSSILAVVDGTIKIGPDSVGASPGPACFARGGTDATLTDALLLAGVLDPDRYLGGELRLDPGRARQAVRSRIAEPLGMAEDAAVVAVIEAFEQHVAMLLRRAAKSGDGNLAKATLLAYGGQGPVIACGIARATGIRRIIIPHMAAVFSAFGIGFSDLAHEYQMPLTDETAAQVNAIKASLMERAKRDMYGEGVDPDQCDYDFSLWSVRDGQVIESALHRPPPRAAGGHERRINLKASFKLPVLSLIPDEVAAPTAVVSEGAAEILRGSGARQTTPVYSHAALTPGRTLIGPALIRGDYMTCLLADRCALRVTANSDLIIEVDAQ